MRSLVVAVCLSVAIVACSSSTSSSTSTPPEACNALVSALCNRAFVCDPTAAADWGGTVSGCITEGETALGCSTATCSSGTFNSGNAQACVNSITALPCSEFLDAGSPSLNCSNVCQ